MHSVIVYLREFHFLSVVLRLLLAVAAGGVIGYGRSSKQRNAGLRTYILVSIGAALTVLISVYEKEMLTGSWAWLSAVTDVKFDGTRYAAQVISGIGFLAAGTIIGVEHQQVSGLTSAIGLIAAAALGIASGAGFYECVIIGLVLIIISMEYMHPLEIAFKRKLHNITLFVEFRSIDDMSKISETVRNLGAQVFDIDIERTQPEGDKHPSAIMTLKLARDRGSHSAMLSSVAELECVYSVQELIS
ncbi:MAG: MgtC/SapB family protein [Oscillospiraceae bacterium]|nr:MgtC/SapB family protein [Oscillospiraceae bacterium]MCR4759484.1 MgtC/SapB family protein [Oscillospiraceae bacterium]